MFDAQYGAYDNMQYSNPTQPPKHGNKLSTKVASLIIKLLCSNTEEESKILPCNKCFTIEYGILHCAMRCQHVSQASYSDLFNMPSVLLIQKCISKYHIMIMLEALLDCRKQSSYHQIHILRIQARCTIMVAQAMITEFYHRRGLCILEIRGCYPRARWYTLELDGIPSSSEGIP